MNLYWSSVWTIPGRCSLKLILIKFFVDHLSRTHPGTRRFYSQWISDDFRYRATVTTPIVRFSWFIGGYEWLNKFLPSVTSSIPLLSYAAYDMRHELWESDYRGRHSSSVAEVVRNPLGVKSPRTMVRTVRGVLPFNPPVIAWKFQIFRSWAFKQFVYKQLMMLLACNVLLHLWYL